MGLAVKDWIVAGESLAANNVEALVHGSLGQELLLKVMNFFAVVGLLLFDGGRGLEWLTTTSHQDVEASRHLHVFRLTLHFCKLSINLLIN